MTRKLLIVEDVYAPRALERMLRRLGLEPPTILRLPPCSGKMERVARAHLEAGSRLAVLADAEEEDPAEKEHWIRTRHRLPPHVPVIVADPCIEAIACQALGLRGCRDKPCRRGPVAAVDAYWRRRRRRGYRKRMLPLLLEEAAATGQLTLVPEARRLLQWLRDP